VRTWPIVLALVSACPLASLDLSHKRCPCVAGYECDLATSTCVSLAAADRAKSYSAVVRGDNPIAYWRFEESGATLVATDEMRAHNATYEQGAVLGASGIFPGTHAVALSACARVRNDDAVFRFAGRLPYTVEVWVKLHSLGDYSRIASTEDRGSGSALGWYITTGRDAGDIAHGVGDGSPHLPRFLSLHSGMTMDAFHHVVFAYDGATMFGWLDGTAVNPLLGDGLAPDAGALSWGCRLQGTGAVNCLDGVLDEAAIYDKTLSDDQVRKHYEAGKPP
jgi:hypothetical protein